MAPTEKSSRLPNCDAYFEAIQSKKKLPYALQECLTSAFAQIPVSSFPEVPGGKGNCDCALLVMILSYLTWGFMLFFLFSISFLKLFSGLFPLCKIGSHVIYLIFFTF